MVPKEKGELKGYTSERGHPLVDRVLRFLSFPLLHRYIAFHIQYSLIFIVLSTFNSWAQPQQFPNVQRVCHWQHYRQKLIHSYPGLTSQHVQKDSVLGTNLWLKCVYLLVWGWFFFFTVNILWYKSNDQITISKENTVV